MSYVEMFDAHETETPLERLRANLGERSLGFVAALVIEALLLLMLLTLGEVSEPHKQVPLALTSFDARSDKEKAPKAAREPDKPAPTKPQSPPPAAPPSPAPTQLPVVPPPAAIIPVAPQQMATLDVAIQPKRPGPVTPPGPVMGPVYTPRFGDSQMVGHAPNGEPMYAAAWYPHEPTHQEMAGYLSTAEPGWALITCKTVPDYRVEDCVGLDEYPENAHLIRAVIAASWQFRVRPPRVGGVLQVGDWVRIKFTYTVERTANPYGDPPKSYGP